MFNVPASMLGIPAVSLPLFSIDGLPLGLQIAGFAGEDASLFALAGAVREVLGAAG
jgi:Asp-tRNA(Asn)/Glu-tRNA(Gln) amidotransferase A subunit family amidase